MLSRLKELGGKHPQTIVQRCRHWQTRTWMEPLPGTCRPEQTGGCQATKNAWKTDGVWSENQGSMLTKFLDGYYVHKDVIGEVEPEESRIRAATKAAEDAAYEAKAVAYEKYKRQGVSFYDPLGLHPNTGPQSSFFYGWKQVLANRGVCAVNDGFLYRCKDEEMKGKAVVILAYKKKSEHELDLTRGQKITVANRLGRGWIVVVEEKTGKCGYVPEQCVRLSRFQPKTPIHSRQETTETDNSIAEFLGGETFGKEIAELDATLRKDITAKEVTAKEEIAELEATEVKPASLNTPHTKPWNMSTSSRELPRSKSLRTATSSMHTPQLESSGMDVLRAGTSNEEGSGTKSLKDEASTVEFGFWHTRTLPAR